LAQDPVTSGEAELYAAHRGALAGSTF